VATIAADLKAHPISADELDRARRPLVETVLADRQTNEYWAQGLSGVSNEKRTIELLRAIVPDLSRVDAADIQRDAQTYLSDAKIWTLEIVPETGAAAAVAH
jgi:zinc protease